jgi:PEGA domain
MKFRSAATVLLWAVVLWCAAAVRAQTPVEAGDLEAGRGHFDRGVEYVEDGDLHGALIEFKRAYAASPNYRVLYNLGQVCNELREYVDAQRYLQMYLTQGAGEIEPARKRDVESMLAKLSNRIATLVLASNEAGAELYVDDVDVGKTPLSEPVRVSTGTRIVTAAMSGRPRVTRVVEAAGGETQVVRLDFPPPSDSSSVARSTPSTHTSEGGSSAVVWLGIGTGALAVGAGVMAYLASRDAADYHDAVHRKTTSRELDDLDNRATTKALVTDILIGATAVAGAVTLIVALRGSGKPDTAPNRSDRAHAALDLGPGSLRLHGQF